jgi:hypothetical protein
MKNDSAGAGKPVPLANECSQNMRAPIFVLDQGRTSRSNPSEKAALERARQFYLKGRTEIYGI